MANFTKVDNRSLQIVIDEAPFDLGVKVKVVGVGDTAVSVFDHLRRSPIKDAQLILIDTDGSRPRPSEVTNETTVPTDDHAPVETDQVSALIKGANLVVIVTCLKDAATELAQTVGAFGQKTGALTIAVVATPLDCAEQPARERAEAELSALEDAVDVLIHVPMSDYQRLAPQAETPAALQEGRHYRIGPGSEGFAFAVDRSIHEHLLR